MLCPLRIFVFMAVSQRSPLVGHRLIFDIHTHEQLASQALLYASFQKYHLHVLLDFCCASLTL